MAISFKCIGCGKMMSAKDEHAGRRIKCGKCAAILTIPGGAKPAVAVPVVVPVVAAQVDREEDDALARPVAMLHRSHPWVDPTFDQASTPWLPGDEARLQRGIPPAREGRHPLASLALTLFVLGGVTGIGYYLYANMFGH